MRYKLLLFFFFLCTATQAQHPLIKVLIVDGFSNHDWKQTTLMTKQILENTHRFQVAVSTTPSTADDTAWASWNPAFEQYDVVVQNTNNIWNKDIHWPRRVEQHLEQYVHNGGGLYILHSANNAFPHWAEYDKMIGLGWRAKDTGYAVMIDSNYHISRLPPGEGDGTNHGDRFDAVIHIMKRHPINTGYPAEWKTASMELYRYARGPLDAHLTILSCAYDSISHRNWPVDWVVRYGKGRVYNSSMGHLWKGDTYPVSYRCVGFQTTMIRAMEWLATGKVTYPVPKNFPAKDAISLY